MTPKSGPFRSFFTSNQFPENCRSWRTLIRSEQFQPYIIVAFTLWLVGVVEIVQKSGGQGLNPKFWIAVAVLITIYTGVRIFRSPSQPTTARAAKKHLGTDELVDRIRSSGVPVLPDNTSVRANGYVVVAPTGVYALEVKEQTVFGSRTVEFQHNGELLLGGRIRDRQPVKSAQDAARRVRERLGTRLPTPDAVRPAVVFVDQWEIGQSENGPDVKLLNASQLDSYLTGHERVFTDEQVGEISDCLRESA